LSQIREPGKEHLWKNDPLTFLFYSCLTFDPIEEFLDGMYIGYLFIQFTDGCRFRMKVRIDQPGYNGFAIGVDHFGATPGQIPDLIIGSQGQDSAIPDGQSLGDGEILINGQYLSVVEDHVRGILQGTSSDAEKQADQDPAITPATASHAIKNNYLI
jgi:hypothetical protein